MKKNYKSVCKKLNKILSERKEGYIDELNKIIDEEVWAEGGELYFDRDVYLSYDCDSEKVRSVVREKPEHVQFEPSEDLDEHPGVTVRFKPYMYSMTKISWVKYNKILNAKTMKELTDISDTVLVSWHSKNGDEKNNETMSVIVPHIDGSGKKLWTIDNRLCYEYFDWIVITKYCPLVV